MSLASIQFVIFIFILCVLHYSLFMEYQWQLLLAGSYIFYFLIEPKCILLLLYTTVVSWCAARLIHRYKAKRKPFLTIGILLLLSQLIVFKYAGFIFETLSLVIPAGLSFYVFQAIGYMVDVYRNQIEPENSFLKYAFYVSFFPQLLQGPIGEYETLSPQLYDKHVFDYDESVKALYRISWGFLKKLVIANNIAMFNTEIFDKYSADYKGFLLWMIVLSSYAIQLYADFSGYMDIVVGTARLFGIKIDENFRHPYLSISIAEYWRNWHITLGRWFRNYMFYPVLRSKGMLNLRRRLRKKGYKELSTIIPTSLCLLITWISTGIWHGASWNYVLYGIYYGLLIILEMLIDSWKRKYHTKRKPSKLRMGGCIVRTFFLVLMGYAVFRPASLIVSVNIFSGMFHRTDFHVFRTLIMTNIRELLAAMAGIIPLTVIDIVHYCNENVSFRNIIRQYQTAIRWCGYISIAMVIIFLGIMGNATLDQFVYFRF